MNKRIELESNFTQLNWRIELHLTLFNKRIESHFTQLNERIDRIHDFSQLHVVLEGICQKLDVKHAEKTLTV